MNESWHTRGRASTPERDRAKEKGALAPVVVLWLNVRRDRVGRSCPLLNQPSQNIGPIKLVSLQLQIKNRFVESDVDSPGQIKAGRIPIGVLAFSHEQDRFDVRCHPCPLAQGMGLV